MPSAGGASDKFGNYYEGLWTVDCMLDILDEKADSICLEPFAEEGFEFWLHKLENDGEKWDGVKFDVNRNGIYEYHQVKTKSTAHWTINSLETTQITGQTHLKSH